MGAPVRFHLPMAHPDVRATAVAGSPATVAPPATAVPTRTARARTAPAAELASPEPRFAGVLAALVYAIAALALGYPALGGRFLATPASDQYLAGYAFREFTESWMRTHGDAPLWNPYLMGGVPHVAAMAGDLFYPPSLLLRALFPTDVAMTWGLIGHVFLAGCFTYLFLRRAVNLGWAGGMIGGLAYMIGGNVAGLVSPGHDGKIFVAALLPLVLFLVHRAVRDGRAWAWGALALSITFAILTPHPQLLQYLLLVAGSYALYVAFGRGPDGVALPRPVALRRLGLAAAVVALGFLGSAIQYWPVLEYTPWSPRAGGKGWEHATSFSMPPEELINTYLPQFSGILFGYYGRNGFHFHSEYIGAAVLPLVGLAFGGPAARRREVWFWGGVLVVATLWALGGFTPFFSLVYALVPGTKYFRAPSTMLYVVSFSTAVLAGYGTERALRSGASVRYVAAWVGAAAVVVVMAMTGMLTNLAGSFALPQLAGKVDENAAAVTLGAWRSFAAVAAAMAVVWAASQRRIRPTVGAWLLAGIVGLDLWSVLRQYWGFSAPAAQVYAADPTVEYLRTQSDSGRVLTLPLESDAPVAYHDPFLKGDALMSHRVRQTLGYHGNELGRFQRLYEGDGQSNPVANPNFWRLTNTRFVLTNLAELPIPGATRVAGPARNAAGTMSYVYRLPGDNPPAWVTPLAVKAADDNVLATVLDPRFDVGRVALFDTAAAVPAQAVPAQLPAPLDLRVRVNAWQPGHVALGLDRPAPAGATLVVSENYYPGWTARVDGRPAQVGRADLTLIGIPLPAGARTVDLEFRSPRYERGRAVTLAVVAASVLLVVGGVVVQRRRTTPPGIAAVG